jgi:molybdate transport system permease protein
MNLWIVLFTLRVAALSTAIIFPIALGIAALLPRLPPRARTIVETLCSLPLILPPTAVGFLLLEVFSRHHWLGAWLDARGIEVLFTPAAVVIATSVMAFPLMFRAFRVALDAVDRRYVDVARTLGATPLSAFLRVVMPLAWRGILAGIVLAYCRAIGEFGATIVIAGNIPGRTQTLALGIYQHIQSGREEQAVQLLVFSIVLGIAAMAASELLMKRQLQTR